MSRTLAIAGVLVLVASVGWADVVVLTYRVNRDTCVYTGGPHYKNVNVGARPYTRAGKGPPDRGEQPLIDWDMAGVQAGVQAELALLGKTLTEAMDENLISVRYEIACPNFITAVPDKDINLQTVMSTNDWWEGDGTNPDLPYGWTTAYAATWMYAGDTVPFSLDTISWMSPIGGWANMEFRDLFEDYDPGGGQPLVPRGTVNSTQIIGLWPTVDLDVPGDGIQDDEIVWSGTQLDEAFWYELIYDDNCVGLRQFGTAWAGDLVPPHPDPANYDNVSMCHLDMWAGMTAPRLVVTIPEPGTLSLLAIAGLALVRRRYGS